MIAVIISPDHPAERAVLAPGVVIPSLTPPHFIAHQQHRNTTTEQQGAEQIALLAASQCIDGAIAARSFYAVIPAVVLVLTISVVFTIGQVVFAVEAHQVQEAEAVMGRN